jgi:23S rRNA (cytosine1962-C5)-methyltransferase
LFQTQRICLQTGIIALLPSGQTLSDNTPVLRLKKNEERRLLAGHLWVYSNEVDTRTTPLGDFAPGSAVAVHTSRDQCIAMATINPHTLICARVYSHRVQEQLDTDLLVRRLQAARQWRDQCYPQPFYRLVHGEGDWLPGLVVDRFGDVLVVQTNTLAMQLRIDSIVEALQQVFSPAGIYLRNTSSSRQLEGLEMESRVVAGEVPDSVEIIENQLKFEVPLKAGQKTGWFYDHRDNRQRLQSLCSGKRVLDAYCYLGAWGMNALAGGASEVVAIDSSETAIASAGKNAALNGYGEKWQGVQGDVSEVLKSMDSEKFDVVILDPPAFIQRAKDKRNGQQKYLSVNTAAVGLLAEGGLLVSGSCSHHLSTEALQKTVLQAGKRRHRGVQVVGKGGQGMDHPVHAAIAETAYLKVVYGRVIQ